MSVFSLPVCNRIPTTNLCFRCSIIPISSQKPKPKSSLKIKTHFSSFSLFSHPLLFRSPVAAFDGVGVTDDASDTEPPETETEDEDPQEEDGDKQGEEEWEIKSQDSEAGRLYVGNLPYSTTSSELADIFAEAGRVVSVEIVYDRVTDRSRGFGFVTMGSVEEAKEAIRKFEGSQIGPRTVKVNFPEVPRGGEREVMGSKIRSGYQGFVDSPHKIYAGNLSWNLTSQALREAFSDQPGLLSAKVIYERDTGRSRGFGFVTFVSAQDFEFALNSMNGVEVDGRPLRLNSAERRSRPAPPAAVEENSGSELESELESSENSGSELEDSENSDGELESSEAVLSVNT